MINALVVIALLATTDVLAGAKTWGEKKGYTYEQQIRRGEREAPNLVTARRVFMGWIGENLVPHTHQKYPHMLLVELLPQT